MFKTRKGFLLLYAIIWLLVLISPYLRYMQDVSANGWSRMIGDWTNLFLLLLLFLINLFVLVPRLLFNDKRSQYFVLVTAMIIAVAFIGLILHPTGPPQPPGMRIPPPDIQPGRPFDLQSMLGTILNNLITAILIIGSIDPCFSCTDRLETIDLRTKAMKVWTQEELVKMVKARKP